jgi:hypothetical protein
MKICRTNLQLFENLWGQMRNSKEKQIRIMFHFFKRYQFNISPIKIGINSLVLRKMRDLIFQIIVRQVSKICLKTLSI